MLLTADFRRSQIARLDKSHIAIDESSCMRPSNLSAPREISLLLDATIFTPFTFIAGWQNRPRLPRRAFCRSFQVFPEFQLATVQACAKSTTGTEGGENSARLHGCSGQTEDKDGLNWPEQGAGRSQISAQRLTQTELDCVPE
jgi:hypothetical protein